MNKTAIWLVAFVLTLVLTSAALWGQENQIVNSEFDDGTTGWGRYGTAGYTWGVVQDGRLSGVNAALIDVTDASATASIGIAQDGLLLEPGKTYPIGFTARAQQSRQMVVLLQTNLNNTSWPTQLLQTIDLTSTPQTYVLEYTHSGDTLGDDATETVTLYLMLKGTWWPMEGDDLNVKVWLDRVYFGAEPPLPRRDLPTEPNPADEATDVWRDTDLAWTPGAFAQTHDVYLGTTFDDVNNASRTNPMDVLVSQGQGGSAYDPSRFAFDQTYYWRVDEVNGPPDNAVIKGSVWSFTTEPFVYPIANVVALSNALSSPTELPANAVNGSGLDANDLHSTVTSAMWLGSPGDEPIYIQFEFDQVYKLHEMLVWNYNAEFEMILGFGLKDVVVEYSVDGTAWSALGEVELAQATARPDYGANSTIDFGGAAVRYVRLTVNSGWGALGQYGLSEVRFLYIPALARRPEPADGTADVGLDASLTWRPGREAASHEVSIGTDRATVADGTAPSELVGENVYVPSGLEFGTTYYWRVDEVNDAQSVTAWDGGVWSFTTQEFAVVEDFEAYDDDNNRIYDTWLDGWVNSTGSTVGHLDAPFAEVGIVYGGAQSMPLEYNNAQSPFYSEASRTWASAQDWTVGGADTLRLHFQGGAENAPEPLYLAVEDSAGNVAVVTNGDPDALLATAWQTWVIPFTDLTAAGVDLSRVKTLYVGVGSRDNPVSGGTGQLYLDEIQFGRLAPVTETAAE